MNDDDRLARLLRSALPPTADAVPTRDVWPLVINRIQAADGWSWLDVSLAAAVLVSLLIFPEWLWLIAFHL